jgi:hypothetical protein
MSLILLFWKNFNLFCFWDKKWFHNSLKDSLYSSNLIQFPKYQYLLTDDACVVVTDLEAVQILEDTLDLKSCKQLTSHFKTPIESLPIL